MSDPRQILKQTFGYDQFRPLQEDIIRHLLAGRDTLAIMPTGGGKSLCYQLPALLFPGLTLVVSPLISLMKDQVEQLNALGIPACVLNSSLDYPTYQAHMEQVRQGGVRLLYLAPETLFTPRVQGLLDEVRLDCLVIDEAHCISEWGHDFRPEYRQLRDARTRYPGAVCLALTATATPRVRQDIQTSLGFSAGQPFIASFDRPNLLLEVRAKQRPERQALNFVARFPGQSGIIYCFSRRGVDQLAEFLSQAGVSALPYHAGLGDEQRRRNQEAFIRDDVQVMVATVAFGMGITRRLAAPGGTGCPPIACCCTGTGMWSRWGGCWTTRRNRSGASPATTWNGCGTMRSPTTTAGAGPCWPTSARPIPSPAAACATTASSRPQTGWT